MKVALICYEKPSSWILGKLALRLRDELIRAGIDARVCSEVWPEADINHHVIYTGVPGEPPPRSTAMITHVDTLEKVALLRRQLGSMEMGICLSSDTVHKLVALGLPAERLCFINYPSPQAGNVVPRQIHVAVTSRVYEHGSKREYLLGELARHLPPQTFTFHIMGSGWDPVVHELRSTGTDVVYYPRFDEKRYRKLWTTIDYYLYLGQDEGSTGLLDALEAGVKTIATPQGFHLDLEGGITHPITDFADLARLFGRLAEEKTRLQKVGARWNWRNYAEGHIAVWRDVLGNRGTARNMRAADVQVPFLPAMPAAPGPGGAVHRPRLLLVANEDVQAVAARWSILRQSVPGMKAVTVKVVGEEISQDPHHTAPQLEVCVADLASWSPSDLSILSLDFDCVAFWNCISVAHLDSLLVRRKPNYLMRSQAMGHIASLITAVRPLDRLVGRVFFGWIRQLQDESRAKVASFAVGEDVLHRLRGNISEGDWGRWWSSMELLVLSDDNLPHNLALTAPTSTVPQTTSTPDPRWRSAFHNLFELMASQQPAVTPSPSLKALRKFQTAISRREP